MDAFYASIEIRDNPKLKGKPVLVGGNSNRGIVTTCSYEARKFGISSAMPIFIAKRKCPDCIIVEPNHNKYSKVSKEIFSLIYKNLTKKIEKTSIDEAYLDLSEYKDNYIEKINYLKILINRKIGITFSVGISYNKFLAKIASDWNKPDGIKVITEDMLPDILIPLNISKVHGIGRKSKESLNTIGIYTIGDLMLLDKDYMIEIFGKHGLEIYDRIRGKDERKIEYEKKLNKSIGKERTLKENTKDKDYLKKLIYNFSKTITYNLSKDNMYFKTLTIKYKTKDFEVFTKSKTIGFYARENRLLYKEACKVLDSIEFQKEIRLIGLSVSNLELNKERQLSFFE